MSLIPTSKRLMKARGPSTGENATFKAIDAAIKQSPTASTVAKAVTDNAVGGALVQVAADTLTPFTQAPPPHQGAVGYVAQGLGGALGLMSAPSAALDSAFAMATADIAALFPALPAATLGICHVGLPHTHTHPPSLIPPAPPVPLPTVGVVLVSGAVNVLVNGIPAARAGDVGLAITCGSLCPPFEIMLGSSNVFIGGARAARLGDLTRVCNPMTPMVFGVVMAAAGMAAGLLNAETQSRDSDASSEKADAADSAAEAVAAAAEASGQALGATMAAAQVAADAVAFAMQMLVGKDPGLPPATGALIGGCGNVRIGGFPCPNLMDKVKGLCKAAKGLRRKSKKAKSADGDAETCGCKPCTGGG